MLVSLELKKQWCCFHRREITSSRRQSMKGRKIQQLLSEPDTIPQRGKGTSKTTSRLSQKSRVPLILSFPISSQSFLSSVALTPKCFSSLTLLFYLSSNYIHLAHIKQSPNCSSCFQYFSPLNPATKKLPERDLALKITQGWHTDFSIRWMAKFNTYLYARHCSVLCVYYFIEIVSLWARITITNDR